MKFIKLLKILLWIGVLWFVAHTAYIVVDGLKDGGKHADYAVVLGTKVNEDGTLSERLAKRVDCALALYRTGRVRGIIVSGGLGKEGHYEGTKMKEYLLTKGVPTSHVIVDDLGLNTRKTVANVLSMQDSLHFERLIVVSQYFHITRTKALFRKAGFTTVSGTSPPYFEVRDVYAVFREFVAFYAQCI